MSAIEPNIAALIALSLAWTAACFGAFILAGMFPLKTAPAGLKKKSSLALLTLDAILIVTLFAFTVILGYRELRWTSLIIAGGMIFLLAPFLVQDLPEALKNGKAGLVIVFTTSIAALLIVWFGVLRGF